MPIFTVPLYEFNPCHEPAGSGRGGQFARVGTCDENPVDWKDKNAPERTRTVYGGTLDPDEVPTVEEAEKFSSALLGAKEQYWEREELKGHLAAELEDSLTTIGYSALFHALQEGVRQHVEGEIGETLEGTVNLEKYRDEYDEFVERQREEIEAQHYTNARLEFARARDEYLDEYVEEHKAAGGDAPEPPEGHEYFAVDFGEGFERWREQEYGEPDYSDIPSFESWAEDRGYTGEGTYSEARGLASYLLHQWAESSGNRHLVSVALQRAAEEAFNLGNTYTGVFTARPKWDMPPPGGGDAFVDHVNSFYEEHKRPLKAFVRAMYAQTQQRLTELGVPEDGYVTVYRGFTLLQKAAPGLATVDLDRGEFVDVRLQPMSSFTIDFNIARDFVGHGQKYGGDEEGYSTYGLMSAVRVPRSRVLSTYISGFGAKNEYEVVLLGGKYTSYIKTWPPPDWQGQSRLGFGEAMAALARQRVTRPPVAPPLPGERM